MSLTARELAKREEFDTAYRQGRRPAMQAVERAVCGCDYGATSWATRDEADLTADALELRHGTGLLEIGAGSGWPALYLAEKSGCDVTLTDLPVDGLRIAAERAASDGLSSTCVAAVADAAYLPFGDQSFDVINHSDVLCCLIQKPEALTECLRVIRPGGRMAFSVIYVPWGLTPEDRARAREAAPEFVDSDGDYPTLLAATCWSVREHHDLTSAFAQSCIARLRIEAEMRESLLPLTGPAEFDRRQAMWRDRIAALEKGHLKRELFVAEPAGAHG